MQILRVNFVAALLFTNPIMLCIWFCGVESLPSDVINEEEGVQFNRHFGRP